jgi:hypothetical protein
MYHQIKHSKFERSAHKVHICILYGSQTAIVAIGSLNRDGVFTVRYELNLLNIF